jgi:GH25 family lysozyme M1 (1,4-beta-N-acetylmuramidase)
MLKVKGIDVSRAQEQFDFTAAVSAGVKFVIIRAGIRTDEDTYFRHNLPSARKEIFLTGFTGILRQRLMMRLKLSCPLARRQ